MDIHPGLGPQVRATQQVQLNGSLVLSITGQQLPSIALCTWLVPITRNILRRILRTIKNSVTPGATMQTHPVNLSQKGILQRCQTPQMDTDHRMAHWPTCSLICLSTSFSDQ